MQEASVATRPTTAQAITKKWNKDKVRKFLMGSKDKEGFIKVFAIYALLICIGFIYIYPILYMISSSFMTLDDLLDSSIKWIPSSVNLENYIQAAKSMDFWMSLLKSVVLAGVPTIGNLISCALAGYGLARFEFPGKKLAIGLIVFTFILPAQITMIATYRLYNDIGILNSIWAFILPSVLAVGLNAPIFILIFYQFFKQVPKVLIEAAQIDGAGYLKSFLQISVPSAAPAFITVGLFSFVWYWNESYLTQMYVSGAVSGANIGNKGWSWTTLVVELDQFAANYNEYAQTSGSQAVSLNESINMAGTMLSILPLLLMYFVLQRYFVESIDRTGITGE